MQSKDDIIAKVRALLNMTVQNGCTEAEANNAMEKAQAMLLAHNLTQASIRDDSPEKAPAGIGKIDRMEVNCRVINETMGSN